MKGSPYTLKSRPGALLEASRNPKMKRSVMKAIGMPMKKKVKKSSTSLVKAPNSRYVRKTAKKGSMSLVKNPKSHRTLRTKKAQKSTFGDEKIQGSKQERKGEEAKHFKKSKSSKKK